ncbi:molybdopterin-guanine dinucleotide biosynthesis protein [Streptantibioticus cattleyicolor NRRL 8057 = DSM 46488]|uniref:Molybdopterin-guanine dinucleotide biosynthesis protein n=1 Tax=Streptantibioticus cattleyicolor (strain ATCC 35852 / DSM 46488 / JCM 4925 / NBRC 14057 / NRRL 8057) TaxID=1003195 RepID=G8WUC2_STREN|nr:molybdopterin-guanine dinucleotide biosynthesis protein [Streptantibioticus cattleyicolor NRRL 8057 = DSM 46488]
MLAGGAARRLGGADKPGLRVGGVTLLDRVLDACADAATTVVVGPPRRTARPVVVVREDPPGGGPLPALAAGLARATAGTVALLAADLPFLTRATLRALRSALDGPGAPDGVLLTDPHGRDQPLTAVYRTAPLRRALAALAADGGHGLAGLPLRRLTARLTLRRIAAPGRASFDCDTWEDLAVARTGIREHGRVLDEWIAAAKTELGIDLDVDTAALLDLARDAAHQVARPAAPLTTFLVGYAAAHAGGGPDAVAEALRKATALAHHWPTEPPTPRTAPSAKAATDAGADSGSTDPSAEVVSGAGADSGAADRSAGVVSCAGAGADSPGSPAEAFSGTGASAAAPESPGGPASRAGTDEGSTGPSAEVISRAGADSGSTDSSAGVDSGAGADSGSTDSSAEAFSRTAADSDTPNLPPHAAPEATRRTGRRS